MQDVEKELIVKASEGDREAFREIYERASGFVYSLAHRVVRRKHDAEEVTQDVFIKIYRGLGSFKFESSFKTWIYKVAVNTALNHVKRMNRMAGREIEQEEGVAAAVQESGAARGLEAEEAEGELKLLLDQLNPDQRACIVLREIEGLDYRAIAESLGVNINTVRSRLKRAREALVALGKKEVTSHAL